MSGSTASSQVLVVGGGPAGSSTAWHLAKAGVAVTLVDRARFPRDKPCAEYLSPEASRILDAMGALPLIEQAGASELSGMLIKPPSGTAIRGDFVASHGFRGFRDCGLALPRLVLDQILLNTARNTGVTVVEGAKVEQLLTDGHGACVGAVVRTAEGLRELRASVVVGADGLRSVVARRLGVAHTSRWPRRFAFVAHYTGVAGMGTLGEMHVGRDGYVGLSDVGHGITNVALVMPRKQGQSLSTTPAGLLEAWLHAHSELRARFAGAKRTGPVKAVGPFASHATRAWAPGAALVGDAADFFDPFTGEGIYAALRGGELVAPYIADALASPVRASAALASYDRERTRVFAGKLRVEKLIALAVAYPWLLERAAVALQRDRDLADLLVGVAGDFIPPRELLRASVLGRLLARLLAPGTRGRPSLHHAHRS